MSINEKCRKKRREIELSQKELADQIGVNQSTIASFESGRSGLSVQNLEKILDVLKIELS